MRNLCAGGLGAADGAGGGDGDHTARVTGKRSDTTRRPSAKFLSTGFGQQVVLTAAIFAPRRSFANKQAQLAGEIRDLRCWLFVASLLANHADAAFRCFAG